MSPTTTRIQTGTAGRAGKHRKHGCKWIIGRSWDWMTSQTHRSQQCSSSRALGWGQTPCRPARRCERPQCPSRSGTPAEHSGEQLPPTHTHSRLQRWPERQWRRKAGWEREEKGLNPGGWRRTGRWRACHNQRNTNLHQFRVNPSKLSGF